MQFILKEEEFYRNRYYELTNELPPKNEKKFIKTKLVPKKDKKDNEIKLDKNIDKTFNWLKYKENSCRYDVFTLIYFLVLEEIIKKNLVKDNIKEVITFYNNFVNSISLLEKKDLNNGIWKIIDNLKDDPLNIKLKGYKNVYAISQLFSPLNNNTIFCFEIKREEKCFKCQYNNEITDYLGPIIQINIEDLDSDIKKTLENKFINQLILCHKCTWIDHGNTILSNNPTLSKIIKNIVVPEIIFLFLDMGEENDDVYKVYNNLKLNLDSIKKFIVDDFYVFNNKFELRAIICMPYSNHYSCLIIKNSKEVQNLKLGANYYYDSQKFGNSLIELDNYKTYIKSDCVPYILIYNKLL